MIVFKLITQSDRTNSKNEVTRWVYRDELTSKTWDALVERLKQLFGTRSNQFFVSWFDGTDYCTIRDFHDLNEAISVNNQSNAKEAAVRIFVSKDKKEHQTIFGSNPDHDPQPVNESKQNDETHPVEEKKPCDPLAETPKPVQSETSPVAVAEEPAPQPTAPLPVPPFMPYAVQYPYGQFYQPTAPNNLYPVLPTAPPQPAATEALAEAHVTADMPAPVAAPTAVQVDVADQLVPNSAQATVSTQATKTTTEPVQPSRPNIEFHVYRSDKKSSKTYVPLAIEALRKMGYQQDEKELKKVVKAFKGDLNMVIDYLEKYSK